MSKFSICMTCDSALGPISDDVLLKDHKSSGVANSQQVILYPYPYDPRFPENNLDNHFPGKTSKGKAELLFR